MTPSTLKSVVEARLVQTFRQYPRAGLHLSSSCRNTLNRAVQEKILFPAELKTTMFRAAENDNWSLQAKLAWIDMSAYYEDAYRSGDCEHNTSLVQAISDGILSAGNIGVDDNVPIRQLPESKAEE